MGDLQMQERFVRLLLEDGPAQGRPVVAARMAGYASPKVASYRLMQKPHILEQLNARTIQAPPELVTDPDGPNKNTLAKKLWHIVQKDGVVGSGGSESLKCPECGADVEKGPKGDPYAIIKAGEALSKIFGWFAPSHRINENVKASRPSSFAAVVQTLKENGDKFAPEDKSRLRQELLVEQGYLQEALRLLSDGSPSRIN